jgi:geranylgeranyl pyrophosphate synthase/predicted secreted hydrolase
MESVSRQRGETEAPPFVHAQPKDWPPKDGTIDLAVHDLPHASSTTEWWYVNSHLVASDGRALSLFAAFFRVATEKGDHAHSLTWAISDLKTGQYLSCSRVDPCAPKVGLDKIRRGHGSKDARLNRAMVELLEKGRVPRPDRVLDGPVRVAADRLFLDYASERFEKNADGTYTLTLHDRETRNGAQLTFLPVKGPMRHGDAGVVRGVHGEDMFYVFVPRCEVTGSVTLAGKPLAVTKGQGWYDHEFGCPPPGQPGKTVQSDLGTIAWNWVALQLDDGTDVSVYDLVETKDGSSAGRWAVLSDKAGHRYGFDTFTLEATHEWRSVRTFHDYPTHWKLSIPEAKLEVTLEAAFADQELVTVLSRPAFWEGRANAAGTLSGKPVSGLAYIERNGFSDVDTLEDFFQRVGEEVRKSVAKVAPFELTRPHAETLVAGKGTEDLLDGVDLPQLVDTMVRPVRLITDRNGKGWRSYAALACCDVVGGDSRRFSEWLAMPELIHVGSLIVDDVEDGSTVRRGGPAAHMVYDQAITINAGTAAYFMGERLLTRSLVKDSDKLRLYDLYFEAMRAGHAGQALDLTGLHTFVPAVLESGESSLLEKRVTAVHRLKTAAPAASLARMGAVAGGGNEQQIAAVGGFFDAVGLAFQIIDDVLNLRGFKGDLKSKGEDICHAKVTLPLAKALGRLPVLERRALWADVASRPTDPAVVARCIAQIESCGALDACVTEAKTLVEIAWSRLDAAVEDSLPKLMLRSFGWFVLERHY